MVQAHSDTKQSFVHGPTHLAGVGERSWTASIRPCNGSSDGLKLLERDEQCNRGPRRSFGFHASAAASWTGAAFGIWAASDVSCSAPWPARSSPGTAHATWAVNELLRIQSARHHLSSILAIYLHNIQLLYIYTVNHFTFCRYLSYPSEPIRKCSHQMPMATSSLLHPTHSLGGYQVLRCFCLSYFLHGVDE